MSAEPVRWEHQGQIYEAQCLEVLQSSLPKWLEVIDDQTTADSAYRLASEGCGLIYVGDYHNAKQLLQALARRFDKKPLKPAVDLLQTFHLHRARQIQRANILNKIMLYIVSGRSTLKRAPEITEVLALSLDVMPETLLLPLQTLQGMIGAYEWRKKGVFIPALAQYIRPHYGVYSPVRGEYLELIQQTPLRAQNAWDIGTGTGVISAILAKRGVAHITATDKYPRALACARDNFQRLGYAEQIVLLEADLFPPHGKADLIVCNPPWLPAKAHTAIEQAVYDPDSRMLRGFLNRVKLHLNAKGEVWLIMSSLAELIGLRPPDALQDWIAQAGLHIVQKIDIQPKHNKVRNEQDPLYQARSMEVTSLYRLC